MELCNKISQLSLVKIISKKQLFFKVELGLKHSKSLLKIAKKNQSPGHNFFLPSTLGVVYKYKKIDILFLKLGFTPCKAEQPLQGMEIQEKEAQKDYTIQEIYLERTCS